MTTVRTFSISAELSAWTVTSGSAAPDASCTMPAIACANAAAGNARRQCEENRERPTSMHQHFSSSETAACERGSVAIWRSRSIRTFRRPGPCESPARARSTHRPSERTQMRQRQARGGPAGIPIIGQQDHSRMRQPLQDLLHRGQSIRPWHRDVSDNDVRFQRLRGLEQRVTIPNGSDQLERLGDVLPIASATPR